MKQRSLLKQVGAVLMVATLIISSLPYFNAEIFAMENQPLTNEQFATVDELKSFNTNDNDGVVNPAKVYFGNKNQQWWIVGSHDEDSLALYAASSLQANYKFNTHRNIIAFQENWNCDYITAGSSNPTQVYSNHYGGSSLRKRIQELERSLFSSEEQNIMLNTRVFTEDEYNKNTYATTDKLYLPVGYYKDNYIRTRIDNGLRIDSNYWIKERAWLRTPNIEQPSWGSSQGVTWHGSNESFVTTSAVDIEEDIVPILELNLSSVIFGSTAPLLSDEGNFDNNDAFTLRYKADDLGSAFIPYNKDKVVLTSVPVGTYLVVQNKNGVKATKITDQTELSARDMDLDSFANCKVWLEKTDNSNRISYATLATEEKGSNVNIQVSEGLTITSNNNIQEVAPNAAITDITVEVLNGYHLPDDYISKIQEELNNGLLVNATDNGFTISGTPTSDIDITLPSAIKEYFVVEGGVKGVDYIYKNGVLTFKTNGNYAIKHPEGINKTSDRIVVSENFNGKLTLDSINIELNDFPCIDVVGNADLTLIIKGVNTLSVHNGGAAAIQFRNVTDSGRLVIDSKDPEAKLNLRSQNGLGIGSSNEQPIEITINGGTITGDKIGSNASNSKVIIKGGNIKNTIIGEAIIDGGFVQGTVNDDQIINSDGVTVHKVNVALVNSEVKSLKVDGNNYNFPINPGTNDIFMYLPSGNHTLTHEDFNGKIYEFSIKVDKNGNVTYINNWTKELSIKDWTYGEKANDPSAEATFGDVTFTYSDKEDGTYTNEVPSNAGTYYVKATVKGTENYTGLESAPVSFKINKAIPTYEEVKGLVLEKGESLSSIKLPEQFKWLDETIVPNKLGTQHFKAIYTPKDLVNYQIVEVDIEVDVIFIAKTLNSAPTINVHDKKLTVGDDFDPLKDVTVKDIEDSDITLIKTHIIKNTVDTSKVGTYEVTYKVSDSLGATVTKTIKVEVLEATNEKEILESVINDKTSNINKNDYTKESYDRYLDALEKAQSILNNPNSSKEDINQALIDLEIAYKALQKVDIIVPNTSIYNNDQNIILIVAISLLAFTLMLFKKKIGNFNK